jgi:hypothetical protein
MGTALIAPSAMAYPPNQETPVVVVPGVIIVGQSAAENTKPRALLKPASSSLKKAQEVDVKRGARLNFVVKFLKPGTWYQVDIKVSGSWENIGLTRSDADGVASLPVVRLTRAGTYPIRMTSPKDPKSPLYFKVVVS